jgi:serine/threonine-protein kinase
MGVVYRAWDLALRREAAIKVLPGTFSPALRHRLLQEADACARLQHPAVATYFEAGETDGTAFIAMQLVKGQTLRRRLAAGPLPVEEAAAITKCVLEALAHAHAAGILHRDIKPENIMLPAAKSAKLLDFGLAKHLTADSNAVTIALTGRGDILGTIGYMAPEQIVGDVQDARTDVFQTGVVLYEMLTGTPAFPGATAAARLAAVMSKDPPPITRGEVPAELAAVVRRALSRSPVDRYSSASAFLRDLIAIGEGEWVPDLPDSLAVLDFENLSASADDDWIGSGIADSLGIDLRRSALSLVERDKVLKIRAKLRAETIESRAAELGLTLGCRWVLTGSYQKIGDALRITARLVEAATGRIIWDGKLDGTLNELFTMQDQLAAATRDSLNVAASVASPQRSKLSAYECYMRGQRLFMKIERGSLEQGLELFEKAIAIDPNYALALTGLASTYAMRFTYTSDPAVLERALSYARRAIEADPSLAGPHVWLGYAYWRSGLEQEAGDEFRRAMELDSTSFWGFYFSSGIAHKCGRDSEALEFIRRAIELEPKAAYTWFGLGSLHLHLANLSEALWSYQQAQRVNSEPGASPFPDMGGYMGECLRRVGKLDEARKLCLESLEKIEQSDYAYRDSFRAFTLVTLGAIALDQDDKPAASAAFHQAVAQIKGRPNTLAGGWLMVRALAGMACSTGDPVYYHEASSSLEHKKAFDFSWLWQCSDREARADLSHAATVLGVSVRQDGQGDMRN